MIYCIKSIFDIESLSYIEIIGIIFGLKSTTGCSASKTKKF